MKKILYISILAIFIASKALIGQVSHGIYISSITPVPETIISAVSLIDPDSGIAYMVGTDNNVNLFITELDSNIPLPDPDNTNSNAFNLTNATGKVYLKDGFFDVDGNIVVYGYASDTYRYGTFIKITMSAGVPTSVRYAISSIANTQIIDGCWSRNNSVIKTYSFISANSKGMLYRVNAGTFAFMPGRTFTDGNTYMSSVSWDDDSKQTIISGFRNVDTNNGDTLSQIVGYYDWNNNYLNNGSFRLFTTTDFISSEFTNKHVLSGNGFYNDGLVYLCQDIRDENDGLWITQYDYYNDVVYSSYAYLFPNNKVNIIDVGHDFMNFFVLGHYNGPIDTSSFERRYIAQFDLYDSTVYIAKRLDYIDMSTLSGSTYYKLHQAFQSCINYNIGTFDMFSTGSTPGKAHIIEVLDLNNDECNNTEITLTPTNISYDQSIMTVAEISHNITTDSLPFSNWTQSTSSGYPISMDIECLTENGGDKKNALFVETLINDKKSTVENISKMNILNSGTILTNNNNAFVCEKFDGECYFKVFNIFGSLIREGRTANGTTNCLNNLTSGTYIIKVTDSKGNISCNKIIIRD
ncbi:MAG: T9SS type A sorting domain-containing protein [Bacteroidales bacterium]|jgi:hypothetical protein|nr:T9SS type A sorting domain-containing protein [Bacteroidales bacterium]